MLSLIENNKANPSMESLQYIAERLGVDQAELLGSVSTKELQSILEEAEQCYSNINAEQQGGFEQLCQLIEPHLSSLTQGYEAARLLELYSRALLMTTKEDWEIYLQRAAKLYEQLHLTPQLAGIGILRSLHHFHERNYEEALHTVQHERAALVKRNLFLDPMSQLNFYYMEAILQFAVGQANEAIETMNAGIAFSKKEQVFYRIEHLYRLATFHAILNEDEQTADYYLHKIQLYGEFTDELDSICFTIFLKAHRLNSYQSAYAEAYEVLTSFIENQPIPTGYEPYFHLEMGKSLYGLQRYEEALHTFEQVTIPSYTNHPFDLSIFYEKEAYEALCYQALQKMDCAKTAIQRAVENIQPLLNTPYKAFILTTAKQVLGQ